MHTKDYYGILEVQPSATIDEIKKAYRKLALLYHPDTNPEDPHASVRFTEIKEAYEVLTSPHKKELYLQQRWYDQSIGKKKTQQIITPESVLKQSLELEKYVSRLDPHRMDKEGLFSYLEALTTEEVISKLKIYQEPAVKKAIVEQLLKSSNSLSSLQFTTLSDRFSKIYEDEETTALRNIIGQRLTRNERIEKYRPLFLFLLVILICLFIILLNK